MSFFELTSKSRNAVWNNETRLALCRFIALSIYRFIALSPWGVNASEDPSAAEEDFF
jgi:hypothetical protein